MLIKHVFLYQGDDLHPSERHCSKDGPRQGSDQIRNSFQSIISPNKFEDIISERKDAGRGNWASFVLNISTQYEVL